MDKKQGWQLQVFYNRFFYVFFVGMRIITPLLATTIFLLFEYNLLSELARQALAQSTIED
jgi:hypothetical protein